MDYMKHYKALMEKARKDNSNREGRVYIPRGEEEWREYGNSFFHRHHIRPKSTHPHLENDPNNIVTLSLREHWVAHKLLSKANPAVMKLKKAVDLMGESSVHFVKKDMWKHHIAMQMRFDEIVFPKIGRECWGLWVPYYRAYTHLIMKCKECTEFEVFVFRGWDDTLLQRKNQYSEEDMNREVFKDNKAFGFGLDFEKYRRYCISEVLNGLDTADELFRTRKVQTFKILKEGNICTAKDNGSSQYCRGCCYFGHLRRFHQNRFCGCAYRLEQADGTVLCKDNHLITDAEKIDKDLEGLFEPKKEILRTVSKTEVFKATNPAIELRRCSKCGREWPVSRDVHASGFAKDGNGYKRICKECESAYRKGRKAGTAYKNPGEDPAALLQMLELKKMEELEIVGKLQRMFRKPEPVHHKINWKGDYKGLTGEQIEKLLEKLS